MSNFWLLRNLKRANCWIKVSIFVIFEMEDQLKYLNIYVKPWTSACLFDLNTTKHENWSVPRIYTRSNENCSSRRNFTSFLIAFTVTSFVAVEPAWVNFVVCNYVCATATSMLLKTARGIVNPRLCEFTRKNWNEILQIARKLDEISVRMVNENKRKNFFHSTSKRLRFFQINWSYYFKDSWISIKRNNNLILIIREYFHISN